MLGVFAALVRRGGLTVALTVGLGLAVPGIAQASSVLISTSTTSGMSCAPDPTTSILVCSPNSGSEGNLNATALESDLANGPVEVTTLGNAYSSSGDSIDVDLGVSLTIPTGLTLEAPDSVIDQGSVEGPGDLAVGPSGGDTWFYAYGPLGDKTPLSAFNDEANGTVLEGESNSGNQYAENANTVVTTGYQTYLGQLVITDDATLDSSADNGNITFGTSPDSPASVYSEGSNPSLTVNAGTGGVAVAGTLGDNQSGDTSEYLNNVTVTGSSIDLPPAVYGLGSATFNGASSVGENGSDLAISGPASFNGTVTGAGLTGPGGELSIQGSSASFGGLVSNISQLSVSDGTGDTTTSMSGGVETTGGGQLYYGPVTLTGNSTLSDSGDAVINADLGVALGGYTLTTGDGQSDIPTINDSSSGQIIADDGGVLALMNNNDYSGGTTVSGGATVAFQDGSLGSGPITVNGGTLEWNNTNDDISSQGLSIGADGATFDTNGENVSFSAPVSDETPSVGGGVTLNGGGSLTLASANSYTGGTTVDNDTLVFGPGSLSGTGAIDLDGGTLQWASGNTDDVSSKLSIDNTNGGALDVGDNDVTLGSNLSSTGPVDVQGAGVLTLAGTDTFGSSEHPLTVQGDGSGNGGLTVTGTLGGALKLSDGTVACNANSATGTINAPFTNDEGSAGIASGSRPVQPGTPTAAAGHGQASVAFTPGAVTCHPTTYKVTATPTGGSGGTVSATGSSSPISVTGLSNGQSYTFTVVAINPLAASSPSSASSPVTPLASTGVYKVESVKVSGTEVTEKVSCATSGQACRLTVTLKARKKSKNITAGHKTVTVQRGKTASISVGLSRSAVKQLHKSRRLSVAVTTSEPGAGSVTRKVTVKYRRKT